MAQNNYYSGSGAPTDATYITQTTNGTLTAEQALSALATGIVKVTTGTGALSTAVAGDFPTLNQSTSGTAAIATTITVADESTDTSCFPLFVTAASGNLGAKTASGLTFNSNTDVLSATGFAGPLTGDVTGNVSGSSGSCTGQAATVATITGLAPDTATTAAAQPNITSVGTLTSVTSSGAISGLTLEATATNSLNLGAGSSATGQIVLKNATNNNTLTFQPGVTAASQVYTLPTAVGAAGTVLTDAAGNGTLSWAAAAGGAFSDWVSVGTGGAYADVQAALTASKYKMYMVSNVTEDSNITINANGLTFDLNGFTLTMAAFFFTWSAEGHCTVTSSAKGAEIDYTPTTAQELFDPSVTYDTANSVVTLSNFVFDNNTTANSAHLILPTAYCSIENIIFDLSNKNTNGLWLSSAYGNANNCRFIGGGTACDSVCYINAGARATNLIFEGTYDVTTGVDYGLIIGTGVVSNVTVNADMNIELQGGATLSNVRNMSGSFDSELMLDGADINVSNVFLGGAAGDVKLVNGDNCNLTNIITNGALTTDNSSDWATISNCNFVEASTLTGEFSTITNCIFKNTLTIAAGGIRNCVSNCNITGAVSISDQTIMSNCKVGADAGGGAATITLAATGSGASILTGNLTDAVIVETVPGVLTGNAIF